MNKDPSSENLDHEFERLEKLLSRGLKEIADIEFDEMIKGMAAEDLDQRVGNDGLKNIERSEYSEARKAGSYVFSENVQFFVADNRDDPDLIGLDELEPYQVVAADTLVAVSVVDDARPALLERRMQELDAGYQAEAGISVSMTGPRLSFHSTRRGKVVLLNDRIYIVAPDRDGTCIVKVARDGMEASIDCQPAYGNGIPLTLAMVLDALDKDSVVKGIDRKLIEQTVETVNDTRQAAGGVVVAKGQVPCDGRDAVITWHVPAEDSVPVFKILSDGRIDYRKQAPIKMVKAGDLVAAVSPPQPGADGFLVDGTVLSAKQGNADVIVEGENVRGTENHDSFFAECSGVVCFNDGVLNVYPHYQVEGDVDMRSGNINFNGSVTVCGNVKSGFEVKAAGDIVILGSVEAATIEAGRDLRIQGAAVGGNGTIVRAGRNILAGHAQNAWFEAQGNVEIVRSAMHSTIFSTGQVVLHDYAGSIVGGTVNAMRGIEAMSMGSPMGTQTEVVAGSDYLVKRRKAEILEIIRFYEANLEKIDMALRPLTELIRKGIPLGTEKKQRLNTIVGKRNSIVKQLRILRQKQRGLSETAPDAERVRIRIRKTLFQDVTLKIGGAILRNHEELQCVEFRLNTGRQEIERCSLGGNAKKAGGPGSGNTD